LLCISAGVLSAGTLHIKKLMASPLRRVQIKKACKVGNSNYGFLVCDATHIIR
jgi:hypothetical protein